MVRHPSLPRRDSAFLRATPTHLAEKILTSKAALEGERKQEALSIARTLGDRSIEVVATSNLGETQAARGKFSDAVTLLERNVALEVASLLPSFRLLWSSHEWKLYRARSASSKPKGDTGLPTETRYQHVLVDDAGTPFIAGTTTKVVELVLDHLAYGWSPEELHFQHPGLTMAQIHSAFAYYWDHKAELDEDIERRAQRVEGLREAVRPVPAVARLRAFRRP